MHTIVRRGSLLHVEKRDINIEAQSITYRHTKNGVHLVAPLDPTCLDLVQQWLEEPGPLLHPYKSIRHVSDGFYRLCRSLGIKDFRFHDLRHDLATRLLDTGTDPLTIKELGGWKSMNMVARYAHVKDHVKWEALARVFGNGTTGTIGAPVEPPAKTSLLPDGSKEGLTPRVYYRGGLFKLVIMGRWPTHAS
jgi:integrase